jgi:hypothetical protein
LVALALVVPPSARGQTSADGWVFTTSPFTDLWFHGMALVDPVGPGPSPLYDPGYPSAIQRAKEAAGVGANTLDTSLGTFRNAFRSDPAFQVLHFLPLYFPQAGRTEVLSALALLAGTGEGIPRVPSPRTSFGTAAIGSVLTTPSQRRVLGEFVMALEEEWRGFYEGHVRQTSEVRTALEGQVNQLWRSAYASALGPFLQRVGMAGGSVHLVTALGQEGRVFGGSPQATSDNVLAVSASVGEEANGVVFSMLRELAFPMVREVMRDIGLEGSDPATEERLAGVAAVRAAALVIQRYRPEDDGAIHRFFLDSAGSPAPAEGDLEGLFQKSFPLPQDLFEALRDEVYG